MSFGLVDIPNWSNDLMFQVLSENSWEARGRLWFGYFALRWVWLEWQKEWLLLLDYHRKARRDYPLQHFPSEVLKSIAS